MLKLLSVVVSLWLKYSDKICAEDFVQMQKKNAEAEERKGSGWNLRSLLVSGRIIPLIIAQIFELENLLLLIKSCLSVSVSLYVYYYAVLSLS